MKDKELEKTKKLLEEEFKRVSSQLEKANKEEKNEIERNLDNIRNQIIKIDTVISEDKRNIRQIIFDGTKTILTTGVSIYLVVLTFKFDADFTTTSSLGKTILGNIIKR